MTMKKISLALILAMAMMACSAIAQTPDSTVTSSLENNECKHARHIILWTLDSSLTKEEKIAIIESTKADLTELTKTIPGVISMDIVYQDRLDSSNCDFMFDFVFQSAEALKTFNSHPDHLKAASKLKPYIKGRTCLDVATPRPN